MSVIECYNKNFGLFNKLVLISDAIHDNDKVIHILLFYEKNSKCLLL